MMFDFYYLADTVGINHLSSTTSWSSAMADKITRIAIVDENRCKPKRCAQECKKVRFVKIDFWSRIEDYSLSHVPL